MSIEKFTAANGERVTKVTVEDGTGVLYVPDSVPAEALPKLAELFAEQEAVALEDIRQHFGEAVYATFKDDPAAAERMVRERLAADLGSTPRQ
ncbi:hypothetical protein [Paraburkholderia sp. J8-2]|uniref:hypothetical protein n=1 Tax=Paraburkholderia sp. J8-2 TaxID=2805440 RepID=UPI002AB706EE|nr:hypothetical protein [Paraburkholderia sp. J8-2]